MLRRVPPVVLAAIATAVVAGIVVAVVLLTGGGGPSVGPCTDALEAGPYGCVVFVSLDGTDGSAVADEPAGGAITYRIERIGGRDHLTWSADCDGGEGDVVVSATRYRLGAVLMGQKACDGGAPVDAWAAGLFTGTVQVQDRDDGTVVLTHGSRSARFSQVAAAR